MTNTKRSLRDLGLGATTLCSEKRLEKRAHRISKDIAYLQAGVALQQQKIEYQLAHISKLQEEHRIITEHIAPKEETGSSMGNFPPQPVIDVPESPETNWLENLDQRLEEEDWDWVDLLRTTPERGATPDLRCYETPFGSKSPEQEMPSRSNGYGEDLESVNPASPTWKFLEDISKIPELNGGTDIFAKKRSL